MTGNEQNFQFKRTNFQRFALFQKNGRLHHFARIETEVLAVVGHCIQHRKVQFVHLQAQFVFLSQKLVAQHMVYVAMRVQQFNGLQFVLLDKSYQLVSFVLIRTARIDDGAVFFFVPNQVSVLLKGIEGEFLQVHGREDSCEFGGGKMEKYDYDVLWSEWRP